MDAPGKVHGQTARLPVGPHGGSDAWQRVRPVVPAPGTGRRDTQAVPHGPDRRTFAPRPGIPSAHAAPTGGPAALTAQALASNGGEDARAPITHTAVGASLAYRRQGALPPLYAQNSTIFRVKV